MKTLINNALSDAMDYPQYNTFFKRLATEGRTTGEQSFEKIAYTKLNFSRSKRLDKTAVLPPAFSKAFAAFPDHQTWLTITEPWCGDSAQTLPFVYKIALEAKHIQLKIVLRDEQPELMDAFLSSGARAIPKIIMLDPNGDVLNTWGPRSRTAAAFVAAYKKENGNMDAVFKEKLQLWYNKDKGHGILLDFLEIMKSAETKQAAFPNQLLPLGIGLPLRPNDQVAYVHSANPFLATGKNKGAN